MVALFESGLPVLCAVIGIDGRACAAGGAIRVRARATEGAGYCWRVRVLGVAPMRVRFQLACQPEVCGRR
jgi:hypothetical protein